MRAMGYHQHGDRSVLTLLDLPQPSPGPGEVLIRVKAVALNHLDVWVRKGWPGLKLAMPHVPCSDVAGEVHAVGTGVTAFKPGDAVVVCPGFSCGQCLWCLRGEDSLCSRYGIVGESAPGGAAEFFCCRHTQLLPKPHNLSFAEAAAFPLTFLTAFRMLMVRAQLQPGETVLVMGASSGVSVAGVQLALLAGAQVIAATRGPQKGERARALGAHHVVDSSADIRKQVMALTDNKGVDVVLEHVGGDAFKAALASLRRGGRLVTCGATTAPVVELDLRHVFMKQQAVMGSTMGSRADLARVIQLFEQNRLKAVVDAVLPLQQMAEGQALLEEQRHFGKVVLVP